MYRCKHSSIHFWDLFYFYGLFFFLTLNSHLQTHFFSDMPISISSLISGLKALALLHYTVMESTTPGIKTIIIIMKWRPVETGKKPQAQSCPHGTIFCMLALLEKGQASDFRAKLGGDASTHQSCVLRQKEPTPALTRGHLLPGLWPKRPAQRLLGRRDDPEQEGESLSGKDFHRLMNGCVRCHFFLKIFTFLTM